MSLKRLVRACLAGAVLCLAAPAAVTAHPPDLPVDIKDNCPPDPEEFSEPPAAEGDETAEGCTGGLFGLVFETLIPGYAAARAALRESLDGTALQPGVERALAEFAAAEEWLGQALGGAMMGCCSARPAQPPLPRGTCAPVIEPDPDEAAAAPGKVDPVRRGHARRMYRIAERCRRWGDLEMAENCYHETKLLCPGCDYARKADHRLQQVQAMRAAAEEAASEEQEPPAEKKERDSTIQSRSGFGLNALGEKLAKALREEEAAQRERAKIMYLMAERYRRCGDLEMAEKCYGEVKLYCADCVHARKAERRLQAVRELRAAEALRDHEDSEEQEPAKESPPQGGASNMNYEVPPPPGVTTVPWPLERCRPEDPDPFSSAKFEWSRPEEPDPRRRAKFVFETDAAKLAEAKVLFFIGERCLKGGDPDMAYRTYEEAHRVCPESRHGQKALQRMKQIEEKRQAGKGAAEEQETPDSDTVFNFPPRRPQERGNPAFRVEVSESIVGKEPPIQRCSAQERPTTAPGQDRVVLEAFCVPGELLCLPVLGRLFAEARRRLPPAIEIVVEEANTAAGDAEEEDEYPLLPCGGALPKASPPELHIPPPVEDLILRDEVTADDEVTEVPAANEDLSDWFRQAVQLLQGGAGTLRIDASRLGRLMARGEEAVRDLGCVVVRECGRSYVVYPGGLRSVRGLPD
jgi:hypothetical protein